MTIVNPKIKIKEGDLFPPLEHTAQKTAEERRATGGTQNTTITGPVTQGANLSGATGATFVFRLRKDPPASSLSGPATIVTPEIGELRYDWQTGDTDVPGDYFGEFVVDFPTGQRTFPVGKPIKFTIEKDLNT